MIEFFENLIPFIVVILICLTLIWGFYGIGYLYFVNISEANIVSIYRGDKLIYTGKKAFIKVDSGGMTTTIMIYKKLFPFVVIKSVYSDKDIRIEAND